MYFLPVSLGEAIDKLSILHIKRENITDERKLDIDKEYTAIYDILKHFIVPYTGLYESMLHTNRVIWGQMDVLRDGAISDIEYMKLCRECIAMNDVRFRIKNKINLISKSELREQKSYTIRRFQFRIEVEGVDLRLFIEPIRQLSYVYDEINIISSKDLGCIKDTFQYDNTILYAGIGEHGSDEILTFYDTFDIDVRLRAEGGFASHLNR
jgi:hypothetical protein